MRIRNLGSWLATAVFSAGAGVGLVAVTYHHPLRSAPVAVSAPVKRSDVAPRVESPAKVLRPSAVVHPTANAERLAGDATTSTTPPTSDVATTTTVPSKPQGEGESGDDEPSWSADQGENQSGDNSSR
ncbi:MAG: hypothetical protein WCG86_03085 [Actinomycetota bacterium]|jgi:hypothetical protein